MVVLPDNTLERTVMHRGCGGLSMAFAFCSRSARHPFDYLNHRGGIELAIACAH